MVYQHPYIVSFKDIMVGMRNHQVQWRAQGIDAAKTVGFWRSFNQFLHQIGVLLSGQQER